MTADDEEWVSRVTGGRVVRFERTTIGRSRGTWLVDVEHPGAGDQKLVLRRDTGDGPMSGTELTLERESIVYAALSDTQVPIPRLVAVADDRQAVLVERARGSEDLDQITDPGERLQILGSFLEALAKLHNTDADQLDLPGFNHPSTSAEHAQLDLDLWTRILDQRVIRPAPMFRFALRWLRENPPRNVQRTVLCHGDAGPGNFLFENGEVTSLLDWEFAHLGDPMDDLAWFVIRTHDLKSDHVDIGPLLRRYTDATGLDIDPVAIQYYRVFVFARMGIACLSALDNKSGIMDLSTYFALLPLLSRLLATLLSDQMGMELEATPLPEARSPTSGSEIIESLASDLGSVVIPDLTSMSAQSRAMGMFLMLDHLQAAEVLAGPIEVDELDDLSTVLGSRPSNVAEGLVAVDRMIIGPADVRESERILRYLGRRADRNLAMWTLVSDLASNPLTPIAPMSHGAHG